MFTLVKMSNGNFLVVKTCDDSLKSMPVETHAVFYVYPSRNGLDVHIIAISTELAESGKFTKFKEDAITYASNNREFLEKFALEDDLK